MTVAVGFFDGVHLGHQAILSGANVAVTFRNHPLSVLAPERAPRLVMSIDDRLSAIRCAGGVDDIVALDFTRELAAMEPADFIGLLRQTVLERSGRHEELSLRCGDNWRFGRGGRGDAELLRRLGIPTTVVPYAVLNGERISSTRIRMAIEAGDVDGAATMLGRRWSVTGHVVPGKGMGREIGFPTLNVVPDDADRLVRPPCGVYAVEVEGRRGVANWGLAPTMGDRAWHRPVLEVHLLESGDASIPNGRLRISFLRFIRPERCFGSLADLKRQIVRDCSAARGI